MSNSIDLNPVVNKGPSIIIQYAHRKNRAPYGLVMAIPDPRRGTYTIGWSKAMKGDQFYKDEAVALGTERAYAARNDSETAVHDVADSLKPTLDAVCERCEKYFENKHGLKMWGIYRCGNIQWSPTHLNG